MCAIAMRRRDVITGVCDFLSFPEQRTWWLALRARWSVQVAQYDRSMKLHVEVSQSNVAMARVRIWTDNCRADGSTRCALEELVRRLPTHLYLLSIRLYEWEPVRSLLVSLSRTVETLELNLGRGASGSWMPPLTRDTPANSLSCDVMRLVMDCTDVDGEFLGDLFQTICVPRFCWRLALKKVASKEILESVLNIVYHRWVVGPSRPNELALTFSLRQQTDQQWARMRHDMRSFLAMKTDWQLMKVRVHLVIRSRRRIPFILLTNADLLNDGRTPFPTI